MTDQEFENCKQALLVAAKMICDQPVWEFNDEAWNRWAVADDNTRKERRQTALISEQCLYLKRRIDSFNQPPQP